MRKAKSKRPLKLTLAMIVKNEEASLTRCLNSVKDVVDEIVIVDTGSTDSSADIALSYGAQVIEHQWRNDFSLARNIGLDAATGNWILSLDADEELPKNSGRSIKKLLEDPQYQAYLLNIINLSDDRSSRHPLMRLWRNDKYLRYEGSIHENIVFNSIDRPDFYSYTDIEVIHYGYLGKIKDQKNKGDRNQLLLQEMILKDPEDFDALYYIAEEYFDAQIYSEAIPYYEAAYKNCDDEYYISMIVRNLLASYIYSREYVKASKLLVRAENEFSDYTDIFFLKGELLAALNKNREAVRSLRKCLDMGPAPVHYYCWPEAGGCLAKDLIGKIEAVEA